MTPKLTGLVAAVALAAAGGAAHATVIDWTTWTTSTPGATTGSAGGTAGADTVSYSGELQSLVANYPSWTPTTSYTGGDVANAPPASGGILQLFGAQGATDTVTFSHPVTDPVLAIWSLGSGGNMASFVFPTSEPFSVVAGGPSAEYGGASIVKVGNTVTGAEGNGVVQFLGTYSSLTWTNPTYEDWYGVTVGFAAVPEPATWALMLLGFGALGVALRRRSGAVATPA